MPMKRWTVPKETQDVVWPYSYNVDLSLVKSAQQKNNFLISQPKHMLWVLKKTVSMRRFFWAPKTYAKNYG